VASGGFRIDMNAFIAGALGWLAASGSARLGSTVHCRWWGRDPGAVDGTALTDALQCFR